MIHEAVVELFDDALRNNFSHLEQDFVQTTTGDHGRLEIRRHRITWDID